MKWFRRLREWLEQDHGNMGAHLDDMTEAEFQEMQDGIHHHLTQVEASTYQSYNAQTFPWHLLR